MAKQRARKEEGFQNGERQVEHKRRGSVGRAALSTSRVGSEEACAPRAGHPQAYRAARLLALVAG